VRIVANAPLPGERRHPPPRPHAFGAVERVVAIIGNAGGPKSLQSVFSAWPASDLASVFVLQPVPIGYGPALANRLNHDSAFPVAEAVDGGVVVPGRALLLPAGCQLEILPTRHVRLHATNSTSYQEADRLLNDLAVVYGPALVAVFISGIGNNGLVGADEVRRAGGAVLVEAETTAIVPETIRRLKAANLVDGEAEAPLLPAATAAFVPTTKRRAG